MSNLSLNDKKHLCVVNCVSLIIETMKAEGIETYRTKDDLPELIPALNKAAFDAAERGEIEKFDGYAPLFFVGKDVNEKSASVFRADVSMQEHFKRTLRETLKVRPDMQTALTLIPEDVETLSLERLVSIRGAWSNSGINLGDQFFWRSTTESKAYRSQDLAEALKGVLSSAGRATYKVDFNKAYKSAVQAGAKKAEKQRAFEKKAKAAAKAEAAAKVAE